jgi:YXWGXW repeat-containing protein
MQRLLAGLILFSLTCGPCAFAQDRGTAATSDFPTKGYLPLPPHFQPRRANAADKVNVAPPPLPSYAQPAMPEEGYLWIPGFWAWREAVPDYFWVPGTWVRPPHRGLLWTPAYWSGGDGGYFFHPGYWAEQVGFYGGIDYGYGYGGDGYQGGRWENGVLYYNRAVNNFGSRDIAHVYDLTITADEKAVRMSFNGGNRGTTARPTPLQEQFAKERHFEPTAQQLQHFEMAAKDRALYSKLNGGEPGLAATSRPGDFEGAGITRSSRLSDDDARSRGSLTTGVNTR